MYTYKVVALQTKRVGLKFELEDLESKINKYALDGWRVSQLVPILNNGYTKGYKIVFEKEI
ncbi:MAG: DUF4177 domain-containing protein [Mobilitalea sp.]